MTDVPNALSKKHRLHEYEIVRVLGVGGFGITYLAFDNHLNKAVAIKEYLPNDLAVRVEGHSVLAKSEADRENFDWGLDRFMDEARTLARFEHSSIIRVIRFFRAHETAYIVMEYIEGETLAAHLRDHDPLDEDELKTILLPLVDGLEQVHQAELLHRDIKPDNIMLRADGSPVLIDFGAARQQVIGRSRSVSAIVTPGYSPQEQYWTQGNQGPWTDIYALGAVCYVALTGKKPPEAPSRMRADPIKPLSGLVEDRAGAHFVLNVEQAMAVYEETRPQNIAQWRKQILFGDVNGGQGGDERILAFKSRRLLAGMLLLMGFGFWIWWMSGTQEDSKQYPRIQDPLRVGLLGPKMSVHEMMGSDLLAVAMSPISRDLFHSYLDDSGTARREADCLAWNAPHQSGPGWYSIREVAIPPWDYGNAVCLTYDEIQEFVQWLSVQSGRRYRLPTYQEMAQLMGVVDLGERELIWTATCSSEIDQRCIRYKLFGVSSGRWLLEDISFDEDASFRGSYIQFRVVADGLEEANL